MPVRHNCLLPPCAGESSRWESRYSCNSFELQKGFFDKVLSFLMLLWKLLEILKINTYLLNWIIDFLSDRQQFVVLRGKLSKVQGSARVPQGSVLGLNLFYTKSMTLWICYYAKFAFTMTLYQTVYTTKDAEVFLNDISFVYEWSINWNLPFNERKIQLTLEEWHPHPFSSLVPHVLDR